MVYILGLMCEQLTAFITLKQATGTAIIKLYAMCRDIFIKGY